MELYVSLPSSQFSKLIYNFKGKWEKGGKISWKDIFPPIFFMGLFDRVWKPIDIITVFHYKCDYVWICYDDVKIYLLNLIITSFWILKNQSSNFLLKNVPLFFYSDPEFNFY